MTTEASGVYRFPALRACTYSVTAVLQGFASEQIRDIVLTIVLWSSVGGVLGNVILSGIARFAQRTARVHAQ
jgi:hypothetical protein